MNKPYSNKALPAGTVLREWRLEDVLGVGGFGIVYKGRGIYFDELVAIKEYFPSSISERDAEDTVVPIDSDAEEVHALGLKKFVEEAKLLWNLSTPTRHPNIVSVRSLFEIHGTAYMVMDFEDGMALSKLLKKGQRFNERSLWNIVRPIAEGLARAHRVGVLHRDIKPPNILINEDGRPVLIDFGSARFEAAEATSTKVTFHTPPYAAIEQYVKTYAQGPWTDIYALGVVLYECVTGEKPPEVLERLHGGLGKALAEGKWPGYSKKFLAAIDAAMTIRPNERPQSIPEWLALFGDVHDGDASEDEADDDATRFYAHEVEADEIKPIAPPETGFTQDKPAETQVPKTPSEAEFKRAGQDTGAKRKKKSDELAVQQSEAAKDRAAESIAATASAAAAAAVAARAPEPDDEAKDEPKDKREAKPSEKRSLSPLVAGGGALVLLAAVAGGWAMFGRGASDDSGDDSALVIDDNAAMSGVLNDGDVSDLATAAKALADDAQSAGAPAAAVSRLTAASEELARQSNSLQALANDPAQANSVASRTEEIKRLAMSANAEFAGGLLRDAEARSRTLAAELPWTDASRPAAGRSATGAQRVAAARLGEALTGLRTAADAAAKAADPAQSLSAARQALAQLATFASASAAAYGLRSATAPRAADTPAATPKAVATPVQPKARAATPAQAEPDEDRSVGVSPAKLQQLNSIVDDARGMARQVIRMGSRGGSGADVRRANAQLARSYDSNLATLKDSGRGMTSNGEVDRLIKQANQTRAYVQFLLKQSRESQ